MSFRAKLRQDLTDRFSEEELRTLCFDLGLDYDSLPAQGKAGKAREIVAQVERDGAIARLIEQCRLLRPNVPWIDVSADADERDLQIALEEERPRKQKQSDQCRTRVVNLRPLDVRDSFRNRLREMAELAGFLSDSSVRLVIVVGRSGMGKSALVSRAFEHIEAEIANLESDVDGVIYLSARATGISLEKLFADISRVLDKEQAASLAAMWKSQAAIAGRVQFLLAALRQGSYLIVLDNVEDLLTSDGIIQDEGVRLFLEMCLVQEHGVRLVITSCEDLTLPDAGYRRSRWIRLNEGLSVNEAVDLLRALDSDGECGIRDASAQLLNEAAEKVHGIPRALERIVGFLRQDRTLILQQLLDDPVLFGAEVVESLVAEGYERLDQDGKRAMAALAVFDRAVPLVAVPFLLSPFVPDLNVASTLRRLVHNYFVTYRQSTGTYELHPLDRAYVYGQLPSPEKSVCEVAAGGAEEFDRGRLEMRAADYYGMLRKPENQWLALEDVEPLLFEIEHCLRAECFERAARIMDQVDRRYLQVWGFYDLARKLRGRLEGHLDDPRLRLNNWKGLAEVHRALGEAGLAIEFDRKALALARELTDRQMERILLDNLGYDHFVLGDVHRAIALAQEALVIQRSLPNNVTIGQTLQNLGQYYSTIGRFEESSAYLEDALRAAKEANDVRLEGNCLGNLGRTREALADTTRAIDLFGQALEIAQDSKDTAAEGNWLAHLARCYAETDQFQEASVCAEQAGEIGLRIGAKRTRSLATYARGIAAYRQGDFTAARSHLSESFALQVADVASVSALWLGMVCLSSGDVAEAQHWFATSAAGSAELLVKTPDRVAYLVIRATALLCALLTGEEWRVADGAQRSDLLQSVLRVYDVANGIFSHPRLRRQATNCLKSLQDILVGERELLAQIIATSLGSA